MKEDEKELIYDNPDNDPLYDEWFFAQIDKNKEADKVWDKVSPKSTGSFSKMAEVERNLKKKS